MTQMPNPHEEAERGHYLVIGNKFDEAISALSFAIDNWGTDTNGLYMCYWDRGIAYDNTGKYPDAVSDFTAAIKLEHSVYLYHARGIAHRLAGDFHSSLNDFETAHEILPSEFHTAKYLSELLACSPIDPDRDGQRSLSIANEIHNGTPETLDLIACANAECGEFELAVKLEEQILAFWKSEDQDSDAVQGTQLASERLRLFRNNTPVRLGPQS